MAAIAAVLALTSCSSDVPGGDVSTGKTVITHSVGSSTIRTDVFEIRTPGLNERRVACFSVEGGFFQCLRIDT